ncbi:MAG: benzoyl-CoA reductase subunit C [Polyangiaceae bacterium]|nr:benzoyl-CoA reductase subunit C [Polyangiaceae bacterium]
MTDSTASDPAAEVLARCLALYEDMSFSRVRRWKEAHPGGLAIGALPIYVPRPLLEAMGCLPVSIFGGGDQLDVIRGDSYFQSYICRIPRSTLELAMGGQLDVLDGMLFPSICDVIRNLGGIWNMLFPERFTAYVDLPQNFDRDIGGRFYTGELRRIAAGLVGRGAKPPSDEELRAAIRRENSRRRVLSELSALRRREPWRLRASEAYLAARAGSVLEAQEHEAWLRELLAALERREARAYDNVRVVVRGAFCEQPPLGLIRTLEAAGCDIVDDDFQLGLHFIEGDIEEDSSIDPWTALSNAYLDRGVATSSRYIGEATKGDALIESVRAAAAEGVIFAAASFCDPALLDQPMLEAALDRQGIPHTSLKYAENSGQFQVIREQAGAFSDAVKLWGSAA